MYNNEARDPGSWGDQPNNGSIKCGLAEIKIET